MQDRRKTKDHLIWELESARARIAELEGKGGRKEDSGGFRSLETGLIEASADAILSVGEDQRIVLFNRSAEEIFGYSALEIIGQPLETLLPDRLREDHRRHVVNFLDSEEVSIRMDSRAEITGLRKNGEEFPALATLQKQRVAGEIVVLVILRDISPQKKGAEELQKTQRLLETVFDALPHYLCVKDTQGNYLMVNEALANYFGMRPREFVGKHTLDIANRPPETKKRALEEDWKLVSGQSDRIENDNPMTLPDGEPGYMHSIKAPIHDEHRNVVGLVGIDLDITSRKKAEEESLESDRRFRDIVENSLQGIVIHAERPLFANAKAAEIFGFDSPEEFLSLENIEDLIHPVDRERVLERKKARLRGEMVPHHYEFRGLSRDGAPLWLETFARVTEWKGRKAVLGIYIDRSERRQAEEELRKSEQQFRSLIEGSIQGLVIFQEQKPVFANQACADIFGYENPAEILALDDIGELQAPEERARMIEYGIKRLKGEPAPDHYEYQGLRKDGNRIWIDNLSTVVMWEGMPAIQVTQLDISARKQAEEKLRGSQQMFRAVLDSLPLWISVKDRELNYLWANKHALDKMGLTLDEFLAEKTMNNLDFLDDETKAKIDRIDRKVLASGEGIEPYEMPFSLLEGGERQFRHFKIPMRDASGECTGIITASLEITDRLRAEAERSRMVAAVEQTGDAIFITDREGVIQYVNPAFEEIAGYKKEEAIGNTPRLLKSGRHDREFYRKMWKTMLDGKVWKARYLNRKKDGTFYETESTQSPVRNEHGEITHFVSVQRDITVQVQLEDQLQRSQRMESLGALTGGIAHDFNNILIPVMGYADLLENMMEPGSKEQSYIRLINKASERASELISQISQFNRRSEDRREPIGLGPLVEEVSRFLESTLPSGVSMRKRIDPGLDLVLANISQLHQVVMNLCVNADQAMPDGGVITLSLSNVKLENELCFFGHNLSGSFVQLTVADSGMGMDEQTLTHIFEPFYTTKEMGQGSGLGLATVYGIVRQHGGGVMVRSTPGSGSEFRIFLPVAEMETEQNQPAKSATPVGGESILFVDDEKEITELGKLALEGLGYRVTALTSGIIALDLIREDPHGFDLVITDQSMPQITGLDLAGKMRELNPELPIILCTGYSESHSLETLQGMGIDEFIPKPYRQEDLGRTIRKLLDR